MDTRTCLEILEDLVLLANNAMVEKQVSSELWEEKWERLFRAVRQSLQVLQRVREKRNWDSCTDVHPYTHIQSFRASQHRHRWPQHPTAHLWAHAHTHSCTPVPGHIHTDCPVAPLLLTTHTHIVLTAVCSISHKRNNLFTDYFPTFPPFLPFPPGPLQQASLWQQCLICLLSL